jgi:DNA-binding beta-propeller fold protein YncE
MVKVDDAVYVANSGGFTTDSVISKIDIAAETISKTIEVGQGPISIVLDKNTEMWVLTRGHNDWNNPDNNRDGNLVKLNNDAIILSIVAKEGAGNLTINNSLDKLYFRMDNMVFEHPISENAISTTPFISRYFYGLGIDHKTDDLFALDPKSFDQDGSLIIYDSNASVLDSTKVGIAPGGLWFD